MLKLLVFCLALLDIASSRELCYDGYGCFKDTYPFGGSMQRPIAVLPNTPQRINTKFFLYKRELKTYEGMNRFQISDSYNSKMPTKFIIGGFLDDGFKPWIVEMANEILKADNVNVIVVDWSKGNRFPYTQATANTQIVGVEIALLVNTLISQKQAKAEDFHLIGHSLGAHICGYAGKKIQGLGRITGLDPAGPYFEDTVPIVRLTSTDATFVDVIHSNGEANLKLGLGLMQRLGHVDFYPNGGITQPSCPAASSKLLSAIFNMVSYNFSGIEQAFACSHLGAINYFIDSIRDNCKYTGYQCKSQEKFENGDCIQCSDKGCNRMGYWASKSKDLGSLYLVTQSPTKKSYCKQAFRISLKSNGLSDMAQTRGSFGVYLKSGTQITPQVIVENSENTYKKNSVMTRLMTFETPLHGSVDSVFVTFQKTITLANSWLYDNQWSFSRIQLTSGEEQAVVNYCPASTYIITGTTVEFRRC